MEKIASFTVDHTTLKEGMYLSRQDVYKRQPPFPAEPRIPPRKRW